MLPVVTFRLFALCSDLSEYYWKLLNGSLSLIKAEGSFFHS